MSQSMSSQFQIRPARADEQTKIRSMIRAAQLDPMNVHWENFLIAEEDNRIIGIGQVKPFTGARELGSLIVVNRKREQGVGAAIINALIEREQGGVLYLFCLGFREPYYSKFGFTRVYLRDLPRSLKFKYAMGWFFTRFFRYKMIAMKRLADG
jgi:amino-acid N-acetyltransferase